MSKWRQEDRYYCTTCSKYFLTVPSWGLKLNTVSPWVKTDIGFSQTNLIQDLLYLEEILLGIVFVCNGRIYIYVHIYIYIYIYIFFGFSLLIELSFIKCSSIYIWSFVTYWAILDRDLLDEKSVSSFYIIIITHFTVSYLL